MRIILTIACLALMLGACTDFDEMDVAARKTVSGLRGRPFFIMSDILGPPDRAHPVPEGTRYQWDNTRGVMAASPIFATGAVTVRGHAVTPDPNWDGPSISASCTVIVIANSKGNILGTQIEGQKAACEDYVAKLADYKRK